MAGDRYSPLSTPSATREVLERHGLYTKYGLGQNFLVSDDVIRKILELANVQPGDRVLEVGPGIGTLTAALLPRVAHVVAIEKDADLPAVLDDTLEPWADRFTLVAGDALNISREGVAVIGGAPTQGDHGSAASASCVEGERGVVQPSRQEERPGCEARGLGRNGSDNLPNKLVSNLPYAVAATVVLDYLQRFDFLESMTVMVQKEVADRMTARPGTKAYGAYTVKLSLFAQPAGRFAVAPGNFFPPPHVESAVLRLDRIEAPAHASAICTMADAAFATRRKTIANSCKTYFSCSPEMQEALPSVFEVADIDPRRRGESLTREEFIRLGNAFSSVRQ